MIPDKGLLYASFLVVLAACGSAQKPPCEGVACSSLCPAGATADWSSDLARACTVGANVEVTVPAQTGKGKLDTRCESVDGVKFICRPVPGDEICGERGLESISRDRVQCGRKDECDDGQRSCTSDSQYITCHKGTWSPALACESDSRCHQGECVPDLHVGCDELPLFKACGGDLEGHWTVAISCIDSDMFFCVDVAQIASGSISFDGGGRATSNMLRFRSVATYPAECPQYDTPCRDQPESQSCIRTKGACVCSDYTMSPMLRTAAVDAPYCRRGDVLDIWLGMGRVRFVRTPE